MQVLKSSDIVSIVGTRAQSVLHGLSCLYDTYGRTCLPGLPGMSGMHDLSGLCGMPGRPGRSGLVGLSGVRVFKQAYRCSPIYTEMQVLKSSDIVSIVGMPLVYPWYALYIPLVCPCYTLYIP